MRALVLNCTLKPSPASPTARPRARRLGALREREGGRHRRHPPRRPSRRPLRRGAEGDLRRRRVGRRSATASLRRRSSWWLCPPGSDSPPAWRRSRSSAWTRSCWRPATTAGHRGLQPRRRGRGGAGERGRRAPRDRRVTGVNERHRGYSLPAQNWTYWNRGPGPGDDYLDSDEGKDWSRSTGEMAASNLLAVARALEAAPVPAPPGARGVGPFDAAYEHQKGPHHLKRPPHPLQQLRVPRGEQARPHLQVEGVSTRERHRAAHLPAPAAGRPPRRPSGSSPIVTIASRRPAATKQRLMATEPSTRRRCASDAAYGLGLRGRPEPGARSPGRGSPAAPAPAARGGSRRRTRPRRAPPTSRARGRARPRSPPPRRPSPGRRPPRSTRRPRAARAWR